MMMKYRIGAIFFAFATIVFLTNCQSIPTQEFDSYLAHFQTAKTSAEDVILRARIRAKTIANDPGGSDTAAVRVAKLNERMAALDARLEALNVIDRYNRVLTGLASGRSPEDIETDLNLFSDQLSNFNVGGLDRLVGSSSPYLGLISEAISLIDGYILAEKFSEIAAAGEKPVLGIVQVLVEDADNLAAIETQWIKLTETDAHRKRINTTRRQIQDLGNALAANEDVKGVIDAANEQLDRYRTDARKKPPINDNDVAPTANATASDIEVLKLLVAQLEVSVDGYNAGLDLIDAYSAMIREYKNLLEATSNSLVSLNRAIKTGRQAAAIDLATNVYLLRESYLALKEAQ